MKSPGEFQSFYASELRPHLEQFEARRRQIVARLTTVGIGVGLLTLLAGAAAMTAFQNPVAGVFALVLGAVLFFIVYHLQTRGFVAEFKESVVGRIVRYVDPNLTYHPGSCISRDDYMASRLFLRSPDSYKGEDLVQGKVDKTEIRFSELHSQYKTTTTDSKGRTQTHWHTIFKGIFFIADFNKHFQGRTVVLPDTAEKLFGRFGQSLQSLFAHTGDLVRLEDVAFEQRFAVYSDDQVEARYILSPALMARILEFRDRTGQDLYISFVNTCIHVAVPSAKNMFEPKLFSSLLEASLAEEYLADLLLVVGIVAELNLNTRIWTKR